MSSVLGYWAKGFRVWGVRLLASTAVASFLAVQSYNNVLPHTGVTVASM